MILMNAMIISEDKILTGLLEEINKMADFNISTYSGSRDPLDVMASVCSSKPSLLIIDDDYLSPNSAHVLRSIKKVNNNLEIIFITSDTSLELGRAVSQLGIYYYTHKPLDEDELAVVMDALAKQKIIKQKKM